MFGCLQEQHWVVGMKATHNQEEEINEPQRSAFHIPFPASSSASRESRDVPGKCLAGGQWMPSPGHLATTAMGASLCFYTRHLQPCSHMSGILECYLQSRRFHFFKVKAKCTHFRGKLCRKILYISAEANDF